MTSGSNQCLYLQAAEESGAQGDWGEESAEAGECSALGRTGHCPSAGPLPPWDLSQGLALEPHAMSFEPSPRCRQALLLQGTWWVQGSTAQGGRAQQDFLPQTMLCDNTAHACLLWQIRGKHQKFWVHEGHKSVQADVISCLLQQGSCN